jgi:hypothetical protein
VIIFYDSRSIRITDQRLELWEPLREWYPIIELYDIHVVQGGWRFGGRDCELRARYHGQPVVLFQSRDARVFGQVRRALLRATEAQARI